MGEERYQRLEPDQQRRFALSVLVISVLVIGVLVGGYVLYGLYRWNKTVGEQNERDRLGASTPVAPVTVTLPSPTQTVSGPVPCPGGAGTCLRGTVAGALYHHLGQASWYCTDEPQRVRCEHGEPREADGTSWFGSVLIGLPAGDRTRVRSVAVTLSATGDSPYPKGRTLAVDHLRYWLDELLPLALRDEPRTRQQLDTWLTSNAGIAAAARIAGYRITSTSVTEIRPGTWSAGATIEAATG